VGAMVGRVRVLRRVYGRGLSGWLGVGRLGAFGRDLRVVGLVSQCCFFHVQL